MAYFQTDANIKVAIYGDAEGYTHTSRQLPDGKWTGKIGKLQDIEHDSLAALTSVADRMGTASDRAYGALVQIMRSDQVQQGQTESAG